MRKRVLLMAVSCKTGGLCPGGLDLDEPLKWIRIVKNDGQAGAVQDLLILLSLMAGQCLKVNSKKIG